MLHWLNTIIVTDMHRYWALVGTFCRASLPLSPHNLLHCSGRPPPLQSYKLQLCHPWSSFSSRVTHADDLEARSPSPLNLKTFNEESRTLSRWLRFRFLAGYLSWCSGPCTVLILIYGHSCCGCWRSLLESRLLLAPLRSVRSTSLEVDELQAAADSRFEPYARIFDRQSHALVILGENTSLSGLLILLYESRNHRQRDHHLLSARFFFCFCRRDGSPRVPMRLLPQVSPAARRLLSRALCLNSITFFTLGIVAKHCLAITDGQIYERSRLLLRRLANALFPFCVSTTKALPRMPTWHGAEQMEVARDTGMLNRHNAMTEYTITFTTRRLETLPIVLSDLPCEQLA
ncbi:hypothetical protein LXA43DRAFT_704886 [Ganoderma leucocontextum]|nr:hypothetical protein LXA43DRAFT_704886 [Ganoderma leucocontextum]